MIYLIIHVFLSPVFYILNRHLTLKLYPGEWTLADRITCLIISLIPVLNLLSIIIRLMEIFFKKIKVDWFKEVNW